MILFSLLWKLVKSFELKTNHCSGKFGTYPDLLNRVGIGEPLPEDIETLNFRVFSRNSKDLPRNTIFYSGENRVVDVYNITKLNEVDGELYTRKANIVSSTKKYHITKTR